jgi:hypothetical protein
MRAFPPNTVSPTLPPKQPSMSKRPDLGFVDENEENAPLDRVFPGIATYHSHVSEGAVPRATSRQHRVRLVCRDLQSSPGRNHGQEPVAGWTVLLRPPTETRTPREARTTRQPARTFSGVQNAHNSAMGHRRFGRMKSGRLGLFPRCARKGHVRAKAMWHAC